ncbi:peptidase inhibitor family I36 protein [Streptomyces sp. HNM0574]|uniref:peptidase inhibitor family I36 protein n=1 Tax=Streptomyces sp. HNM0574 TaxID=2714954 RepID=UPI00146B2F8F|nr:peptidase inhibitor family I36 protein [Streptomyces sp. HNM0574]NLU66786.1 hypothetical protein [Streptomyces sp. HNM0574]
MKFRKGIATAAATLVVAGGAAVGTTGTAQAAKSDCPKGYLCSWSTTHFKGKPGKVSGNNANLRKYHKFATSRSIYNNGKSCSVKVWAGTGMSGKSVTIKRGYQFHDTKNSVLRNGAGSNRWC